MANKRSSKPILSNKETNKNIIKSKTFWANILIASVITFLPEHYKKILSNPETLTAIFTLINIGLRLISKDKVSLF